ncbi:MAG: hypothetical protein ABIR80_08345, partial [Opitutaceae bacterium]
MTACDTCVLRERTPDQKLSVWLQGRRIYAEVRPGGRIECIVERAVRIDACQSISGRIVDPLENTPERDLPVGVKHQKRYARQTRWRVSRDSDTKGGIERTVDIEARDSRANNSVNKSKRASDDESSIPLAHHRRDGAAGSQLLQHAAIHRAIGPQAGMSSTRGTDAAAH